MKQVIGNYYSGYVASTPFKRYFLVLFFNCAISYSSLVLRPIENIKRIVERCPSGLRSTPGKRVYANRVPRVRIPLSPPPYVLRTSGGTPRSELELGVSHEALA